MLPYLCHTHDELKKGRRRGIQMICMQQLLRSGRKRGGRPGGTPPSIPTGADIFRGFRLFLFRLLIFMSALQRCRQMSLPPMASSRAARPLLHRLPILALYLSLPLFLLVALLPRSAFGVECNATHNRDGVPFTLAPVSGTLR
jgi:hypothetical protein